jgi:hypothetical protein
VGDAVSENAAKSFAVVKHGASAAGVSASTGAKSAGAALGVVADSAGNALGALGGIGDLNGDGKMDFGDAKIAAAKVRNVAGAAAGEIGQLGKSALQSKLVQEAAAGALVGGVLASMISLLHCHWRHCWRSTWRTQEYRGEVTFRFSGLCWFLATTEAATW